MGQLRRTARRLGADISELAKIRTTEGIVTRTAGGMIHVQRQGQTAEDARPYVPIGNIVPGQRVRLLGDLAFGLDSTDNYRTVRVDYRARDDYWDHVLPRQQNILWPAPIPVAGGWYGVVPGDDGKLYHVPAHMPWPQDHTKMLVSYNFAYQEAARGQVPNPLMAWVVGAPIAYLDMPYWSGGLVAIYDSYYVFEGSQPTAEIGGQIFLGGGGVALFDGLTLVGRRLWDSTPDWNFPPTIVAARLTATMYDDTTVIDERYMYLPVSPNAVTLTAMAPWDQSDPSQKIVWANVPAMLVSWLTDADPSNARLTLELAFIDQAGDPVPEVIGIWELWPSISAAVTIPPLSGGGGVS